MNVQRLDELAARHKRNRSQMVAWLVDRAMDDGAESGTDSSRDREYKPSVERMDEAECDLLKVAERWLRE